MKSPHTSARLSIAALENSIIHALQSIQGVTVEPYRFQFDAQHLPTLRSRCPLYLVIWNESQPLEPRGMLVMERHTFVVACVERSFRRDAAAVGDTTGGSGGGPGVYALVEQAQKALHRAVLAPSLPPARVQRAYGAAYANGLATVLVELHVDQPRDKGE